MTNPTPQAIQQRYWELANSPSERGYVQVRALDSLSRLLDLFPRPKHTAFFAVPTPEPAPQPLDPSVRPADVVLMSDKDLDALMVREEADAAAQTAARTESEDDDEDDEPSNSDEDEPP